MATGWIWWESELNEETPVFHAVLVSENGLGLRVQQVEQL